MKRILATKRRSPREIATRIGISFSMSIRQSSDPGYSLHTDYLQSLHRVRAILLEFWFGRQSKSWFMHQCECIFPFVLLQPFPFRKIDAIFIRLTLRFCNKYTPSFLGMWFFYCQNGFYLSVCVCACVCMCVFSGSVFSKSVFSESDFCKSDVSQIDCS